MTIYQNNIAGSGFLQGPTGAPGPAANTYIQEYEYIATQGQTTFSGNDKYNNPMSYVANTIFVVLNGSVLNELEEYDATDGSTVRLYQAAAANDELIVYTFPPFNVANTYTQQQANTIFLKLTGGTISGNLNFANGSNFTVPVGNTAQRPAATAGFIRYNTDLNTLESANATAWANVGSGSASSGGGVSWQPVQNTNFIAVAGNGYTVNTALANVTVTLPASPTLGNYISIVDYARTFGNNALIIYPNGNKLSGNTANASLTISGEAVSLLYTDTVQGWISYSAVYTSPVASYPISYLIVAGGGGGGSLLGGGGGAGGLLTGTTTNVMSGTPYTVTVGSGGAGNASNVPGTNGVNSFIFGLTAIGGGGGGSNNNPGVAGGSGGGAGRPVFGTPGGAGTTGQGNPGGAASGGASGYDRSGGGGGAGGSGVDGAVSGTGGNGGTGTPSSISGSSVTYAGGGGGTSYYPGGTPANAYGGSGGSGGGGNGATGTSNPDISSGTPGQTNTGGGGGGGQYAGGTNYTSYPGGSGIIIISYPSPQRGSGGSVTFSAGKVIHTFTTSGTFVA